MNQPPPIPQQPPRKGCMSGFVRVSVICLLCLAVLGWIIGETDPDREAIEREEEVIEAPIEISEIPWSEINQIYAIDAKATDMQKDAKWKAYKGKRVRWQGEVVDVTDGMLGGLSLSVKMNSNTFTMDLVVRLRKSEKRAAMNLSKGSKVTFEGTLYSWGSLLPITLKDGAIGSPE